MEADLQRFYGIDYRDRWRPDEHGRPRLTLRRLWVLISHLPPESTLAHIERAGHPEWTLEAHLLDTIRMILASTEKKKADPWPGRFDDPAKKRAQRERQKQQNARRAHRLADARRRAQQRREDLAAGRL